MNPSPPPSGEILLYETPDGQTRVACRLVEDTLWLTQALMAELYEVKPQTITHHLKVLYNTGELSREATCRSYLQVRTEGGKRVSRNLEHYSLDAILAVGYRVQSSRGMQFRRWATERLREYLVKGFVLDDERLKGRDRLADHFDELLARIRDIRASEARVYQRIREIFALAADYREDERNTQIFFAAVQNKMHFAATGMTAAELIHRRADAEQPNMGLTAWSGDRVLKRDVGTAKNYLLENEIDVLNRITVMFLDQAEFRSQRRKDIRMQDWTMFLDKFLRDTELPVLDGAGAVSHEDALAWAGGQYDAFADRRRLEAEANAEARYLDDLRQSARQIETTRPPENVEKP